MNPWHKLLMLGIRDVETSDKYKDITFEFGAPKLLAGPALLELLDGSLISLDSPYYNGHNCWALLPVIKEEGSLKFSTEANSFWTQLLKGLGHPLGAAGLGAICVGIAAIPPPNPFTMTVAIVTSIYSIFKALEAQEAEKKMEAAIETVMNAYAASMTPLNLVDTAVKSDLLPYTDIFNGEIEKLVTTCLTRLEEISNKAADFIEKNGTVDSSTIRQFRGPVLEFARGVTELKRQHHLNYETIEEQRLAMLKRMEALGNGVSLIERHEPNIRDYFDSSDFREIQELISLASVASSFGVGRPYPIKNSKVYLFPQPGTYKLTNITEEVTGRAYDVKATAGTALPNMYAASPKRWNVRSEVEFVEDKNTSLGISMKVSVGGIAGASLFKRDLDYIGSLDWKPNFVTKELNLAPGTPQYIKLRDYGGSDEAVQIGDYLFQPGWQLRFSNPSDKKAVVKVELVEGGDHDDDVVFGPLPVPDDWFPDRAVNRCQKIQALLAGKLIEIRDERELVASNTEIYKLVTGLGFRQYTFSSNGGPMHNGMVIPMGGFVTIEDPYSPNEQLKQKAIDILRPTEIRCKVQVYNDVPTPKQFLESCSKELYNGYWVYYDMKLTAPAESAIVVEERMVPHVLGVPLHYGCSAKPKGDFVEDKEGYWPTTNNINQPGAVYRDLLEIRDTGLNVPDLKEIYSVLAPLQN